MRQIHIALVVLINIQVHAQNWVSVLAGNERHAWAVHPVSNGQYLVLSGPSGDSTYCGAPISPGLMSTALSLQDASGKVLWIASLRADVNAIGVSNNGNIFIVGQADTINQLNSASSGYSISIPVKNFDKDGFIACYSPQGNLLWVKSFGSPENIDWIADIACDPSGGIYVCGGSIRGYGSLHYNAFISRYDNAGNLVWKKESNWNGQCAITSIALTPKGNILGSAQSMDIDSFTFLDSTVNMYDVPYMVINLSPSGNLNYLHHGGKNAACRKIAALNDEGYVMVGGVFPNTSIPGLNSRPNYFGEYISVFDSTGNNRWTHTISYRTLSICTSISGDVICGGSGPADSVVYLDNSVVNGSCNFQSSVTKFDKAGKLMWNLQVENLKTKTWSCNLNDIAIGPNNSIYAIGEALSTLGFDSFTVNPQATSAFKFVNFVAIIDDVATGYQDIKMASFKLYPSPTEDFLHVYFAETGQVNSTVTITNIQGAQSLQTTLEPTFSHHTINVSDLPRGIYFLTFKNEKLKTVGRFIKN